MERIKRTVRRIDPARYKRLLSQTMPVIIETEEENERTLKVIEKLMDKGEEVSAEEETLLKLLTKLVEDFEQRYYHPRDATPLEVASSLNGGSGDEASTLIGSIWLERDRLRGPQPQTQH